LVVPADPALRELREGLLGLPFFHKRRFQQPYRITQAKFRGPRLQRAGAGNLIAFDRLRCSSILRGARAHFLIPSSLLALPQ
jgi:hypothetical protein